MDSADLYGETDDQQPGKPANLRRRLVIVLSVLLVVLLLVFLPPLVNVGRFQHRIATNLSAALGRPVHLDRVSLTLLPLPGFTLENFVVDEDPVFGYEPILRATEVRATLRLSSLWGRRVEFSRISLTDPTSLNLVRLPDGRWNFEPVLLQASRIEAAPTAQTHAGPAPRFPYIEASGARINLKLGQQKTPFSLTDSEFALWLPEPRQWHFRLEAHPARTDVAPSDTGVLRLEGTLGDSATRAALLREVPIDLSVNWQAAPLAGLGRLVLSRDAGLRGELTLDGRVLGTVGHAALKANISLSRGRRADFIPARFLSFEAACQATADNTFQSFSGIECYWPPPGSSDREIVIATGSIPDARSLAGASANFTLPALPSAMLIDWLQAATPHPPTAFSGSGTLAGILAWHPGAASAWSGEFELAGESLALGTDAKPIALGDVLLGSPQAAAPAGRRGRAARVAKAAPATGGFDLQPIELPLGGRQPVVLDGHFDTTGYSLHLVGNAVPARLLALADAIPQFGEGLRALLEPAADDSAATVRPAALALDSKGGDDGQTPVRYDLTATRRWGGAQTWRAAAPGTSH